ncbi:MAG: glycosyltransferase [Brevinema sp.]
MSIITETGLTLQEKDQIKVSIIINTYNMDMFIKRSLESALNQTMTDIEIIVVDNASTDKTVDVVRSYMQKDSRIRLIALKENIGLLRSRITGGFEARGQYLTFLDADDRLHVDFCSMLYKATNNCTIDLIQCDGIIEKIINGKSTYIKDSFYQTSIKKINGDRIYQARLTQKISVLIWGKLYRTELYQKAIQALDIPIECHLILGEDEIQTTAYCYFANSYAAVTEPLYYYLERSDSLARNRRIATYIFFDSLTYLKLFDKFITKYSLLEKFSTEIFYEHRLRANYLWDIISKYSVSLQGIPLDQIAYFLGEDIFVAGIQGQPMINTLRSAVTINFPKNKIRHPKKIMFFLNRFYNGGIERVVSQYINYLHCRGFEIIVFTVEKPHRNDYDIPKEITRVYIGTNIEEQLSILKLETKRLEIDVIYLCVWDYNNFYFILMLRMLGIHVIFACHGYLNFIFHLIPHTMEMISLVGRTASMLTTVSRTDMVSWQMAGVKNALYVPNPLSFDHLDMGECDIESDTIAFVGRIENTKGIFDLIKALPIVLSACPKAHLIIVGGQSYMYDDSSVVYMNNLIKEYHLEQSITLTGFQKDILPYLKKASIFCFPTYMDSWGMVYSEAKSIGLPTVVSDFPHLELYSSQDSISFELGNIIDLADKLIYLLQNPDLRKQMGIAAKENLKNFSNEFALKEFEGMIDAIATDRIESYIIQKEQEFFGNNKIEWCMRSQELYFKAVKAYNILNIQSPSQGINSLLEKIVNKILPLQSKRRSMAKKMVYYILSKLGRN